MAEEIIDGTGSGKRAKVDNNNRLFVHSISETISENASQGGDAYNINTGTVTLTNDTETPVLYFKNIGDNDIQVSAIGYLLGNSTGGTGNVNLRVLKNPTGGTIISDAIDVAIKENKNAGSSNQIDANAYVGATGKTITGGTDFYISLLAGAARPYVIATGNVVLPTGASIAVQVTPQSGNTSMDLQVFLSVTEYTLT